MEEKYVSYLAFESVVARQERTIKRLWILLIIMFLTFASVVIGFFAYESQYEDIVTIEQDVSATTQECEDITLNQIGGNYNGNYNSETKNN